MKRFLILLCGIVAVIGCTKKIITQGDTPLIEEPSSCNIRSGTANPLSLCALYTPDNDPDSLVLIFGQTVSNVYYGLGGDDAYVHMWIFREDAGNLDRINWTYSRPDYLEPGETWGFSIAQWSGYEAVQIGGQILIIEDVIYKDE